MDLFSQQREANKPEQPLAARMRPRSLEEFIGQEEIVGEGQLLRRAIEADRLQSLIFYGPPGTGKTTLARIIAATTEAKFKSLNAVSASVEEIRQVIKSARERQGLQGRETVLFLDELHRFNKSQQDALLPAVESGRLILIGATTENPYFEINSPLLSRSRVFELTPLSTEEISRILETALADQERGLGDYELEISSAALDHLAQAANGDARQALNALELAVLTTPSKAGVKQIDLEVAEDSIQEKAINYDQSGDQHYDVVSAFVKSLRGSDPDAALYWLAKMIKGGEEPEFIARRLIVHAAEDVGNANPHALLVAEAAARSVEYLGLPEARIPLAQAALYIATAPKSNSALKGIDQALQAVEEEVTSGVPSHLQDTHYQGSEDLGRGKGYKYPHDYSGNYVQQDYLPAELAGTEFYQPSGNGYEERIKEFLDRLE